MTENPLGDENSTVVDEHIVLKIFDGEVTQEEIESGEAPEPVEQIVIHNGETVEHWKKEDTEN